MPLLRKLNPVRPRDEQSRTSERSRIRNRKLAESQTARASTRKAGGGARGPSRGGAARSRFVCITRPHRCPALRITAAWTGRSRRPPRDAEVLASRLPDPRQTYTGRLLVKVIDRRARNDPTLDVRAAINLSGVCARK